MSDGIYQSVDLTENSSVGYINLSATSKYIYALYSDKKFFEKGRKSNVILVFDWDGNAIQKYILDTDAYYIAVDDTNQTVYAAVKNAEGGWRHSKLCYLILIYPSQRMFFIRCDKDVSS